MKLKIIIILWFVAFLNAAYLTNMAFNPKTEVQKAANPYACDINSTFNCSDVVANPLAYVVPGVPFPLVAMIVYPVLIFIAAWGLRSRNYVKAYTYLMWLSLWGILFNSVLIYRETFYIKAFCPLCLLCTALIISIFLISLIWKFYVPRNRLRLDTHNID